MAKAKYFFFQKGPPGPPQNDKLAILEILKIEIPIFWRNTAPNEKSEENRPPQNHPKILPDWLSQDVLTHFKEVTAILFKMADSVESKLRITTDMDEAVTQTKLCFHGTYTNRVEKQVKFDMMIMLSLIGGNMGFWLGLSVVHIMDMAIDKLT